jgi:diamine N-acetyltransferase
MSCSADGCPNGSMRRARKCSGSAASSRWHRPTWYQQINVDEITRAVTLREITSTTARAVIELSVSADQVAFVAPNTVSIAEAHFTVGAWFRAVFANHEPVGFVMTFDPKVPGAAARGPIEINEIGLWRLMIDHRSQRRGYGRAALDCLVQHVRRDNRVRRILSSYLPGVHGPELFYLRYGFRKLGGTGTMDVRSKSFSICKPRMSFWRV